MRTSGWSPPPAGSGTAALSETRDGEQRSPPESGEDTITGHSVLHPSTPDAPPNTDTAPVHRYRVAQVD